MKQIDYDKEVDILTIQFADEAVIESDEIYPQVIADYNATGEIIRIEILHFSTFKGLATLSSILPSAL